MKVMIVAEQTDIQAYLRQLGGAGAADFFQYVHPLKAMDNLEEIAPTLVLWNADDFPRHWKIFLPFSRMVFGAQAPAFHLVGEQPLPAEEQGKAEALKVDGIHGQGFFDEGLAELLGGAADAPPAPGRPVVRLAKGSGTIQLQHPELRRLVIGELLDGDGVSLHVRFPDDTPPASFKPNALIEHAIFRIGDSVHEALLRLGQTHPDGSLDFLILDLA